MITVEQELKEAITWDIGTEDKIPQVFETDAKCNWRTVQELKALHKNYGNKQSLLKESRKINLVSLLCLNKKDKYIWHITPVFSSEIAVRLSSSHLYSWCISSYVRKTVFFNPGLFSTSYIRNDDYEDFLVKHEPSLPPLIPKNVVEICKHIKSFRTWKDHSTAECEPMILYKPDSYKITTIDPAIVAKIGEEWRVFAIWGDIVEQAEIISFQE